MEIYARVLVCSPSGTTATACTVSEDFQGVAVYPYGDLSPTYPDYKHPGLGLLPDSVQVTIRLGHNAQLRKKPTQEGFTHDWKVFVRGPEGGNIQNFVEKVVFYLHESFPKAKRVVKEPPYEVSESGYAGFELPIDIYFKTKGEPRKIRFNYDLFFHLEGSPPVHHMRCEKLTFQNPTEDFRKRLLASAAVIAGIGAETGNSHSNGQSSKSSSSKSSKLLESTEVLKQEVKPEVPKPPVSKVFTDLFGSPLTKGDVTTATKKVASKPTSHSLSKEKKDRESSSHEKKDKEKFSSSSKHSGSGSKSNSSWNTSSPATPPTGRDKHSSSNGSSSKDKDRDKHRSSKEKERSSSKRPVESPPAVGDEGSSKKKKRIESAEKSPPESKSNGREREREKEKSSKSSSSSSIKTEKVSIDSSSKHSGHKHKSSKRERTENEVKEVKREKDLSAVESKPKHHSSSKHDRHEKEKRQSKDKDRQHRDSPSLSQGASSASSSSKHLKKKSESKSSPEVDKPVKTSSNSHQSSSSKSTSSSNNSSAKKSSPSIKSILPPFQDELSTGELSDLDPFGDDVAVKVSPERNSESNSPKDATPRGLSSLIDELGMIGDSDSEFLSPLVDRSPPNIFSQHSTHSSGSSKASPKSVSSPANQSDRATPTSLTGSSKDNSSPSSSYHRSSPSKAHKSKHRDSVSSKDKNSESNNSSKKDSTSSSSSSSKRAKYEKRQSSKDKESSSAAKENKNSFPSIKNCVDIQQTVTNTTTTCNNTTELFKTKNGTQQYQHQIADLNGLPHLERSGHHDLMERDMNGLPELVEPGDCHIIELEKAPNGESLSLLVELQQRLMTASDNSLLSRVVDLIEQTGQYKIDDNTFNFDLCNLDRNTVQKLQTCLLSS